MVPDAMEVIPQDFICPITCSVMEYPYTTRLGNSYEYGAITKWLKDNASDPRSNMPMKSKRIIPNNALRAQIVTWFEQHPEEETKHRNRDATKPPSYDDGFDNEDVAKSGLDKIMRYKGKRKTVKRKLLPEAFSAYEHKYSFTLIDNVLQVRCDDGEWIEAPNDAMFVTAKGVVFYDPKETRNTRVLPGTEDGTELCNFGYKCNRDCSYPHPFVCDDGVECVKQDRCKFLHPERNSVVPLGPNPHNEACMYGTRCTESRCAFAHPRGRLTVTRRKAIVVMTHTQTLQKLPNPIALTMDVPDEATCFQFQGEFAFFFKPFVGLWATKHYQKVIVHRFDTDAQAHKLLGEYSLAGNYCNCAVGAGRYFIISFWPYEEEAMRTIWENLKIGRGMETELKKKSQEISNLTESLETKDMEISKLKLIIGEKDALISKQEQEIDHLKGVAAARKKEIVHQKKARKKEIQALKQAERVREAARQARESQAFWRREQLRQERQRNERYRLRDPIHIYALSPSGTWTMVLDYHKGAHDINLVHIGEDGEHALEITENDNVFLFDLIVPQNVESIDTLPVVPRKLCADF